VVPCRRPARARGAGNGVTRDGGQTPPHVVIGFAPDDVEVRLVREGGRASTAGGFVDATELRLRVWVDIDGQPILDGRPTETASWIADAGGTLRPGPPSPPPRGRPVPVLGFALWVGHGLRQLDDEPDRVVDIPDGGSWHLRRTGSRVQLRDEWGRWWSVEADDLLAAFRSFEAALAAYLGAEVPDLARNPEFEDWFVRSLPGHERPG